MGDILQFKTPVENSNSQIPIQTSCIDFCMDYFKDEKGENKFFSIDQADMKEIPFPDMHPPVKAQLQMNNEEIPDYITDDLMHWDVSRNVKVFWNPSAKFNFVAISQCMSDGFPEFFGATKIDVLHQIFEFDPTRFKESKDLDLSKIEMKIEVGNFVSIIDPNFQQEPIMQLKITLMCPFSVTLIEKEPNNTIMK